jgi:hypothetical protein
MTPVPLRATLAATCLLASGCSLFSRKDSAPKAPKESTAISADVEQSFRKRWVEKRRGELTAQGIAADAATAQADREFAERYDFRSGAKK